MTYYAGIKKIQDASIRHRTIEGLQRLRRALAEQIPIRTVSNTLLLATWNIREFDSGKYGYRSEEAYYYIAEILNHFDLIAIQEVRDGLYPLQHLQRLLGDNWQFLVTDVTLGTSGNSERMAYLYDRRKVSFTGLAAELVLPKDKNAEQEPLQLARSPYVAGFKAGWAYLTLATVHIYYGKGMAVDPRRFDEIKSFSRTIAKHAAKLSGAPQYQPGTEVKPDNLIMLGDFNIFNRHYDQIAYYKQLSKLKPTGCAGVFDFFEHVYRLEDEAAYARERETKPGRSFKDWRTYRMSDHLPMWIELGIDDSDTYLSGLK